MNKYPLVTAKAKQAASIICFCLLFAVILPIIAMVVFSPPEPVASQVNSPSDTPEAPAHIIISIMDLQREINRRDLNLKVAGRYGPLTQAAHEIAIGDQYAKKLMVWEIE